jgi:hypothetical protein
MNDWQTIWNKRQCVSGPLSLDELIRIDGFDIGAGSVNTNDWQENVNIIATKLGLAANMSVFEIGCSSGAFL